MNEALEGSSAAPAAQGGTGDGEQIEAGLTHPSLHKNLSFIHLLCPFGAIHRLLIYSGPFTLFSISSHCGKKQLKTVREVQVFCQQALKPRWRGIPKAPTPSQGCPGILGTDGDSRLHVGDLQEGKRKGKPPLCAPHTGGSSSPAADPEVKSHFPFSPQPSLFN